MGFHHVSQAGLELLASSDKPTSASQSAVVTGMSHHVWLRSFSIINSMRLILVHRHTKNNGCIICGVLHFTPSTWAKIIFEISLYTIPTPKAKTSKISYVGGIQVQKYSAATGTGSHDVAQAGLKFLGSSSSDPSASAPLVAGIKGMCHHAWLIFVFLVETGFCHVGQVGLELLTSGDPPASASQNLYDEKVLKICFTEYTQVYCTTYLKMVKMGRAWWLMPVIPAFWEAEVADHLRKKQTNNKCKTVRGQAQWLMPAVEGLLEPKSLRPAWATWQDLINNKNQEIPGGEATQVAGATLLAGAALLPALRTALPGAECAGWTGTGSAGPIPTRKTAIGSAED
ncbi:hypothetical protein AAY473_018259 [Plecturocebus cupreus]